MYHNLYFSAMLYLVCNYCLKIMLRNDSTNRDEEINVIDINVNRYLESNIYGVFLLIFLHQFEVLLQLLRSNKNKRNVSLRSY